MNQNYTENQLQVRKLIAITILAALVIVLSFIRIPLGIFSITISLVPIVIGSILYGPAGGAFLGAAMAISILASGEAAYFLNMNPIATIIIVMSKSTLAGLVSGIVYNLLKNKNKHLAIWFSSLSAPIINTGVFILGCILLLNPELSTIINDPTISVLKYTLISFVGVNFFIELGINLILAPVIVYIVNTIAPSFNQNLN